MAAFLFLLALLGAALVGDVVWENTADSQVTVLDRTVAGYPQGWLLAGAAVVGFLTALLLIASVGSTRARRTRRKHLRALKRDRQEQGYEPEHAAWLEESLGRRDAAADTGASLPRQSEPLYEETRQDHLHDDRRRR